MFMIVYVVTCCKCVYVKCALEVDEIIKWLYKINLTFISTIFLILPVAAFENILLTIRKAQNLLESIQRAFRQCFSNPQRMLLKS